MLVGAGGFRGSAGHSAPYLYHLISEFSTRMSYALAGRNLVFYIFFRVSKFVKSLNI